MQPLGTKVYLLKRYSLSDSFYTIFSESVLKKKEQYVSKHLPWVCARKTKVIFLLFRHIYLFINLRELVMTSF